MTRNQIRLCNAIASFYKIPKLQYMREVLDYNGFTQDEDIKFKNLLFPVRDLETLELVHSELSYSGLDMFLDPEKFKKSELFKAIQAYPYVVFDLGKWLMVGHNDQSIQKSGIQLIDGDTFFQFNKLKDYLPKFEIEN